MSGNEWTLPPQICASDTILTYRVLNPGSVKFLFATQTINTRDRDTNKGINTENEQFTNVEYRSEHHLKLPFETEAQNPLTR
jgi:hypothetical protein